MKDIPTGFSPLGGLCAHTRRKKIAAYFNSVISLSENP